MKKSIVYVSCILLFLLAVSCTTNHKVALSQNKNVIGKNGIKRPEWVLHDQSNQVTHYASAFGTGHTFETAKQKAKLAADAEIALWISTSAEAVRDRHIEESSIDGVENYMDSFLSTMRETAKAVLSGVTEEDYWEDIEGGVWVLVSIPVANIKAQIQTAIETTGADRTLFASEEDAALVMAKLEKALDAYFPET